MNCLLKIFSSNPKREEILKIFEEEYASQPDDFYLISNLAGMYRALGMEQKQNGVLEKAIKIISNGHSKNACSFIGVGKRQYR